ncbi:hypothetical protein SESBI_27581 [Sesbania bispinosa]|nr:hypothetical protein SESBI_27581 [Sesbania bispinosa]
MLLKLFSRFRERFVAWVLDDGRGDEERERPQQTGTKREEKGGDAGYTSVKRDEFDIESGETLYPGLSLGENQLRWGFIRMVHDILFAQILLTTIVSIITVFYSPINLLLRGTNKSIP